MFYSVPFFLNFIDPCVQFLFFFLKISASLLFSLPQLFPLVFVLSNSTTFGFALHQVV